MKQSSGRHRASSYTLASRCGYCLKICHIHRNIVEKNTRPLSFSGLVSIDLIISLGCSRARLTVYQLLQLHCCVETMVGFYTCAVETTHSLVSASVRSLFVIEMTNNTQKSYLNLKSVSTRLKAFSCNHKMVKI